jgi:hypothetical protein
VPAAVLFEHIWTYPEHSKRYGNHDQSQVQRVCEKLGGKSADADSGPSPGERKVNYDGNIRVTSGLRVTAGVAADG